MRTALQELWPDSSSCQDSLRILPFQPAACCSAASIHRDLAILQLFLQDPGRGLLFLAVAISLRFSSACSAPCTIVHKCCLPQSLFTPPLDNQTVSVLPFRNCRCTWTSVCADVQGGVRGQLGCLLPPGDLTQITRLAASTLIFVFPLQ